MKLVDHLLFRSPSRCSWKLARSLAVLLRWGSSVKRIHSGDWAAHADDTVTNAHSSAQMKARERFIAVSFMFAGKARPFAEARRFKLRLVEAMG
jgi:hypothetical protein